MNSKLRDEILNHLHIMGCQAMTQGHNDATSGKDIDLDWVEEFEENATDGLLALFERQLVEEKWERVRKNRSICGCMMCLHHTEPYDDYEAQLKANKSREE